MNIHDKYKNLHILYLIIWDFLTLKKKDLDASLNIFRLSYRYLNYAQNMLDISIPFSETSLSKQYVDVPLS